MFDKTSIAKILDRIPLTLIIIGVLVFVIGAAGGLPIGDPPLEITEPNWRIGLGILGVLLFLLGIFFLWRETLTVEKHKPMHAKEFTSITEATPLLCEIASKETEKLLIEIIASTGATTLFAVLPSILKSTPVSHIEISVFLINRNSPLSTYYPPHWANEVDMVIERIKQDWPNNVQSKVKSFNVFLYDFLPVLHGIMINKKHLVFGFFSWKHFSGKVQLSGSETNHRYFSTEKHPDAQFLLDVFDDWVQNMPGEAIFTLNTTLKRIR